MGIVQSVEQAARCGELELEEQADKELSETIIQELRDEYPDASEEGLKKTAGLHTSLPQPQVRAERQPYAYRKFLVSFLRLFSL